MDMQYRGKSIVITGGSSGIGLGLAERFASQGAKLFLLSSNAEQQTDIKERLEAISPACETHCISCDISDFQQVQGALSAVERATDCVDLLINNAGFATYRLFREMPYEEVIALAQTNFTGHAAVTAAFLPLLKKATGGQICFVSSIAAKLPITPNSVYCGAKFGMEGLAIALRHELKLDGISVTSVFPGRVVTPFFDHETFQSRNAGGETKLTTPLDVVCDRIIAGLAKRKSNIFVPRYWRIVAFLYKIDFLVSARVFDALLQRRLRRLEEDVGRT